MPATKRKSGGSAGSQPPLSFNNRSAKITKPSTSVASTSSKAHKIIKEEFSDSVSTPSPAPEEVDSQIANVPTTTELAIRQQVEEEKTVKTEEEIKAETISDAQIKQYWKAKEAGRKAPRIHQQGLTVEDKILREFDLSYQYGPCVGILRTKRWKRAQNLGLKPPIEVLAVLMKMDAKNSVGAQRAYVDELLASKFVTN